MKKCRTKKDLINNPYVSSIHTEYQYGVFDNYDDIYILSLKGGYWFKEEGVGCLHEATIKDLCDRFNSMTISKRTDEF